MTDARWIEIEADAAAAARHLGYAVELLRLGGFDAPGLDGYRASMAFLHAMQSGHPSLESALLRIPEMLGEERPARESWHADLVRRATLDLPGRRPPILGAEAAGAADETRRFRSVAARNHDGFRPAEAGRAVTAAALLAGRLPAEIAQFRDTVDTVG